MSMHNLCACVFMCVRGCQCACDCMHVCVHMCACMCVLVTKSVYKMYFFNYDIIKMPRSLGLALQVLIYVAFRIFNTRSDKNF